MADGLAWETGGSMRRGGLLGSPGLRERIRAYERQLIVEALREAGGNQRRAAAALGCLPTTLNEKMRRLGLRERDLGASAEPSSEDAHASPDKSPECPPAEARPRG